MPPPGLLMWHQQQQQMAAASHAFHAALMHGMPPQMAAAVARMQTAGPVPPPPPGAPCYGAPPPPPAVKTDPGHTSASHAAGPAAHVSTITQHGQPLHAAHAARAAMAPKPDSNSEASDCDELPRQFGQVVGGMMGVGGMPLRQMHLEDLQPLAHHHSAHRHCPRTLRQASLERYRAKKARRLFGKRIRYEMRKVNADRRPRVKGRFVKAGAAPEVLSSEAEAEAEPMTTAMRFGDNPDSSD